MPTPRFARWRFGARRVPRSKLLGVLVAVLAMASITAVAVAAGSTTLATGKAKVKTKTKTVVVDSSGVTLYTLSGESVSSVSHLKCVSSMCFKAWPPYEVSATAKLTKPKGISGTLSRLKRVKAKFYQVMLNGRPLYRFVLDGGKKGLAKGEGIIAFGGTWHVVSP
jgi:predicted lipoprotein with Yx(FWY)xxD motif